MPPQRFLISRCSRTRLIFLSSKRPYDFGPYSGEPSAIGELRPTSAINHSARAMPGFGTFHGGNRHRPHVGSGSGSDSIATAPARLFLGVKRNKSARKQTFVAVRMDSPYAATKRRDATVVAARCAWGRSGWLGLTPQWTFTSYPLPACPGALAFWLTSEVPDLPIEVRSSPDNRHSGGEAGFRGV